MKSNQKQKLHFQFKSLLEETFELENDMANHKFDILVAP